MVKLSKKYKLTSRQFVNSILTLLATYVIVLLVIGFTYIEAATSVYKIIAFASVLALIFLAFGVYIFTSEIDTIINLRKLIALCATFLVSIVLIVLIGKVISIYFAPFAVCALCVALLIGTRSGFFTNFIVSFIYFLTLITFTDYSVGVVLYPLITGILSGIFTAYIASKHKTRLYYVVLALYLSIFSAISCIASNIMIIGDNAFSNVKLLENVLFAFTSGVLSVMLFFILVPMLERIFNIVTDFRLGELTNVDTPLLKRLYKEAPGTFNHSQIVANYAEACATAIGANAFLAKVCGLYHDVGKLKNPQYFKENQLDDYNPHQQLTPELSVSFIKQHTINGLAIAREYNLPIEVQQVTLEHHGTTLIRYFYSQAQKFTEGELDYSKFSYDGPKPTSKISAIIMICDACEAALRALPQSEKASAGKVVASIIEERMQLKQFNDCDLTMKELETIKQTILTSYMGISHERIKYPEIKNTENK